MRGWLAWHAGGAPALESGVLVREAAAVAGRADAFEAGQGVLAGSHNLLAGRGSLTGQAVSLAGIFARPYTACRDRRGADRSGLVACGAPRRGPVRPGPTGL